jgi:anti-sigma B factor antagonist
MVEDGMAKENKNGTKKTIKPGKNIVASMVIGLKGQIMDLINQGVKEITMDFSGIDSFDSNGLNLLISAQNSLSRIGGKLKIKNASEKISKFVQVMHLDKHFEITS